MKTLISRILFLPVLTAVTSCGWLPRNDVSPEPPTLSIVGPTTGQAGECLQFSLELSKDAWVTSAFILSTSGNAATFSDVECAVLSNIAVVRPQKRSVSFYVKDIVAEQVTVSAYSNNSDQKSIAVSFSSGSPSQLVWSGATDGSVGECGKLDISVKDDLGNLASLEKPLFITLSKSIPGNFYSNLACSVPVESLELKTGTASVYYRSQTPGRGILRASAGPGDIRDAELTIERRVLPPTNIALDGPRIVELSRCAGLFVITSRDPLGNNSKPQENLTVTPAAVNSANAPMGQFFTSSDCSNASRVTTLVLSPQIDSTRFYFKPTNVGVFTLRATASGLMSESLAMDSQSPASLEIRNGNAAISSFAFGEQFAGSTTVQQLTLRNSGTRRAQIGVANFGMSVYAFAGSGSFPGETATTSCPTNRSIAGVTSCTISIRYRPTTPGSYSSLLLLPYTDVTQPLLATLALSGTAVPTVGDLDFSFASTGRINHNITRAPGQYVASATQSDGKIVVAGRVLQAGSWDWIVARYRADGTPDSDFGNGGFALLDLFGSTDLAYGIAVDESGAERKLVVVGASYVNGKYHSAVVRLRNDGSPDISFNPKGPRPGRLNIDRNPGTKLIEEAQEVIVQSDGRIIVAGHYEKAAGDRDLYIVRLNQDGSYDEYFGTMGILTFDAGSKSDRIDAIAQTPENKILLAGGVVKTASSWDSLLLRVTSKGELDSTFGTGGMIISDLFRAGDEDRLTALAIQPDGKMIAAGAGVAASTFKRDFAFARFMPNGDLDRTFGRVGKQAINFNDTFASTDNLTSLKLLPDGGILASGYADQNGTYYFLGVAKLTKDGALDTTFGQRTATGGKGYNLADIGPGSDMIHSLAVGSEGRLIAFGESAFEPEIIVQVPLVATFSRDGILDPRSTRLENISGSLDSANQLTALPDGNHLASVSVSGGYPFIARIKPDGSFDSVFGKKRHNISEPVLALQPDGKYLVGGYQYNASTFQDFAVNRYNPNGSIDTSFNNGSSAVFRANDQDFGRKVIVQSDGKIVMAGDTRQLDPNDPAKFTFWDITTVRWNSNGLVDETFAATVIDFDGGTDITRDIHLQSDGKLVIAAQCRKTLDGSAPYRICVTRLSSSNGTLDTAFGTNGKTITTIADGNGATIAMNVVAASVLKDEQNRDKILVAAYGTFPSTNGDYVVVRYNANGTLDTSFGNGGIARIVDGVSNYLSTMAVDSAGRILLAGYSFRGVSATSANDITVMRLLPNGIPDNSFGAGGIVHRDIDNRDEVLTSIALRQDGATEKLLLLGHTWLPGSLRDISLYQLILGDSSPQEPVSSPNTPPAPQ